MVMCLGPGADLHMTQPLTVSCFSKIEIGFIFLVPAHLTRVVLDKMHEGHKTVVCVCVCVTAECYIGSVTSNTAKNNVELELL